MFKFIRAFVIAVVVAVSLLGGASTASANSIGIKVPVPAPVAPLKLPHLFDITWE